jgi:hypothetical protein
VNNEHARNVFISEEHPMDEKARGICRMSEEQFLRCSYCAEYRRVQFYPVL